MRNQGRFSKEEVSFVQANAKTMSPQEIAENINRDVVSVRNFMIKKLGMFPGDIHIDPQTHIRNQLKHMPEWDVLKEELSLAELEFFGHRYAKIMSQFHEDVLPTEETQIFLLIRYEILMQRNMKDTKRSISDIERMEKDLRSLYTKHGSIANMPDVDKGSALQLTDALHAVKSASQSKSSEYVKLTEKHSAILKELKATRDQRVSKIENAKETFLDLMKAMQTEEFRNKESRNLDLIKLAAKKETERLSSLHTFVDKEIDRPLLTPETVMQDE